MNDDARVGTFRPSPDKWRGLYEELVKLRSQAMVLMLERNDARWWARKFYAERNRARHDLFREKARAQFLAATVSAWISARRRARR